MKKEVWGFVFLFAVMAACKKDAGDGGTTPPPAPPVVETAPLKSVATFPIAVAGSFGAFMTNATSSVILKRDFNGITFENEMKNNALVNGSGGIIIAQQMRWLLLHKPQISKFTVMF